MGNILALDQSSRTTGYSIFSSSGNLIKYGHFTFDNEDIGVRLHKIKNKVHELINEFDIECLILEDIQYQNNVSNNVQTFKVLAEVFGVIHELAVDLDLERHAVLAAQWKSALKIKGKTRPEQKKNAQQYVIDTYNVKPTQDEADSICIGNYYFIKYKPTEDFNWE